MAQLRHMRSHSSLLRTICIRLLNLGTFSSRLIAFGLGILTISYFSLYHFSATAGTGPKLHDNLQHARPPNITGIRHVNEGVWGGFWHVDTTFSPPPPLPKTGRRSHSFKDQKGSCHDLAAQVSMKRVALL